MKKVILALAIVSVSFAACNNDEKKTDEPKTDTVAAPITTPVDTASKMAPVDTAHKMAPVDTAKKAK